MMKEFLFVLSLLVVLGAANNSTVATKEDFRGLPTDNPIAIEIYVFASLIGCIILTPVYFRFLYFLRQRNKESSSQDITIGATFCGYLATHWHMKCCAVQPQTLAVISLTGYYFTCLVGIFRSNILVPFAATNPECATIYILSYTSFAVGKFFTNMFEYFRLVLTFKQSALKLSSKFDMFVGLLLTVLGAEFLVLLGLIYSTATGLDIPSRAGKRLCTARPSQVLRWWGRISFLIALALEFTFFLLFVTRINTVDSMSEAEPSQSSHSPKPKNEHNKEHVSHFKKLAVKLAALTFVMMFSSFVVLVIGGYRTALSFLNMPIDSCFTGVAIWLTFHDTWAERTYNVCCQPCDLCFFKCYPVTKCCFYWVIEKSHDLAETISQMTSISSRNMPSYASDMNPNMSRNNTARSVGSDGGYDSAQERELEVGTIRPKNDAVVDLRVDTIEEEKQG